MNIQIFGSSKSFDSKKAERWFKERRIKYQYIDLPSKGLSRREYQSVKQKVGFDALVNTKCRAYEELYMAYITPERPGGGSCWSAPELFVAPIVRNGERGHGGLLPGGVADLGISRKKPDRDAPFGAYYRAGDRGERREDPCENCTGGTGWSCPKTRFLRGVYLLIQRFLRHKRGECRGRRWPSICCFMIFPLLIFVSALLGLLHLDVNGILAAAGEFLPRQVVSFIEVYLNYVAANPQYEAAALRPVLLPVLPHAGHQRPDALRADRLPPGPAPGGLRAAHQDPGVHGGAHRRHRPDP